MLTLEIPNRAEPDSLVKKQSITDQVDRPINDLNF